MADSEKREQTAVIFLSGASASLKEDAAGREQDFTAATAHRKRARGYVLELVHRFGIKPEEIARARKGGPS